MSFDLISSGPCVPDDVHVIIEIPANAPPVKYEVDKQSGAIFVDRFMSTAMFYPANYGYIPQTLAEDGDPVDVLVVTPHALQAGVVLRCRILGMLNMEDEAGIDTKLIALPIEKICPFYSHIKTLEDLPPLLLQQITHFFEHYKDLEAGKWVKVKEWSGIQAAHQEILAGISRYKNPDA
jgi:inorganic pyrophosphatase